MQPVALRGVMAAFDLASEVDEGFDYWPDGAIEGLRRLVKP